MDTILGEKVERMARVTRKKLCPRRNARGAWILCLPRMTGSAVDSGGPLHPEAYLGEFMSLRGEVQEGGARDRCPIGPWRIILSLVFRFNFRSLFQCRFWIILGPFWASKWTQNSIKNRWKTVIDFWSSFEGPKWSKMIPKPTQNPSKTRPKHGPKTYTCFHRKKKILKDILKKT